MVRGKVEETERCTAEEMAHGMAVGEGFVEIEVDSTVGVVEVAVERQEERVMEIDRKSGLAEIANLEQQNRRSRRATEG